MVTLMQVHCFYSETVGFQLLWLCLCVCSYMMWIRSKNCICTCTLCICTKRNYLLSRILTCNANQLNNKFFSWLSFFYKEKVKNYPIFLKLFLCLISRLRPSSQSVWIWRELQRIACTVIIIENISSKSM